MTGLQRRRMDRVWSLGVLRMHSGSLGPEGTDVFSISYRR